MREAAPISFIFLRSSLVGRVAAAADLARDSVPAARDGVAARRSRGPAVVSAADPGMGAWGLVRIADGLGVSATHALEVPPDDRDAAEAESLVSTLREA